MEETIKEILIRRDGNTEEQAEARIRAAQSELNEFLRQDLQDEAYLICEDHFGLEPDYLDELIAYD